MPIKRAEGVFPEVYDSNGQGWTDRSGSLYACMPMSAPPSVVTNPAWNV